MHSVVFLHVPKTGGMSFAEVVLRQFPRRARFQADAPDLAAFRALWGGLAERRRALVRCIHGHLPFGVHGVLPEPARYVTLLRDPVDRVVSAYFYALRRPEVAAHRALVSGNVSLHGYVTSELSSDVHDAQTRVLCGGRFEPEVCGRDAVAFALHNLAERCAVVGLCERLDESALLCRRVLGWRDVRYASLNRNRRRPHLADLPAPTIAAIRERNTLDLELYSTVAERFAELLRSRPIPPGELRAFQRSNRRYGVTRRVLRFPIALLRDARTAATRERSR